MLSIILGVLLLIALCEVAIFRSRWRSTVETSARLLVHEVEQTRYWRESYQALDQGMEEQADSYEQQFLTFQETIRGQDNIIEKQRNRILELESDVDRHNRFCLPTLVPSE